MNNCFDLALNYLTYRSRTIKEVKDYLKRKKFRQDVIDETLDKLIEYNYLNDRDFVKLAYESNKVGKQLSKKRLEYDLKNKGINREDLKLLESLYSDKEEREHCYYHFQILTKKTEGFPYNKRIQKIMHGLNSKGFGYNLYSSFLNEIDKDTQIDMEAFINQFEKTLRRFQNRGYSDYDLKNRVIKSLMGKGYDYSIISDYYNENY